jgi:prepilin-type processing-associated H-X9-DG protein
VVSTVIDNINGEFIQAGLIYPYVNNTNLYRCPADLKTFARMGVNYPQVRSYAMNCCISPLGPSVMWNNPSAVLIFYKDTDFTLPGPSMTFVLIDENENSINDTLFVCGPNDPYHWQEAPATRHAGAGSISFADGHSEMKRWTDRYILQLPTIFVPGVGHASDANSADWAWLSQRTTVLLNQ